MAKLANFEVTFELKELKIHVKGDREIAPSIANNVGRQFASMLSPAALLEGPKNGHSANGSEKVIEGEATLPARRKKRGSKSGASGNEAGAASVNWAHDVARWGSPLQTWKSVQKIAWLLYVVEQAAAKKDLTTTEMVDIFNSRFREAGLLTKGNIPRDLGNNPDSFGLLDGRWFLKQAGRETAEKLISQATSGATVTAA